MDVSNSAFDSNNLVSLEPAQQPLDQVSIDTGAIPKATIPDEQIAASRASKAHMGLSDVTGQDYPQMYQQFKDGGESAFRSDAALKLTAAGEAKRIETLRKVSKTSSIGLEDYNKLMTYGDKWQADPDSVIEQAYGKSYADKLNEAALSIKDTVLDDARAQDPEVLQSYFNKSSDLISKREWWLTKAQDIENNNVKKQSTVGYLLDQLKQVVPFYNEVQNRDTNSGVSATNNLFLGENMEATGQGYLRMPFDEMKAKGTAFLEQYIKGNPSAAASFARSMAGMSTTEKVMNDLLTPLEVVGLGDALKLGLKAGRAADVSMRARKAFKDTIASTNVPVVTKATIAEGVGDIDSAAINRAAANHTAQLEGLDDATKASVEILTSDIKAQTAKFEVDKTLSREGLTRLTDAANGYARKLIDLVVNTAKIERVPWITATEEGYRILKAKTTEYFPGRANTILDVDIVKDPISGSLHREIKIGDYDASQFTTLEQAQNHAQINGYGEAKIVQDTGRLPSARGAELRTKITKAESELESNKRGLARVLDIVKRKDAGQYQESVKGNVFAEGVHAQVPSEGGITRQQLKDSVERGKFFRDQVVKKTEELKALREEMDKEAEVNRAEWQGERGAPKDKTWKGEGGVAINQQGLGYHIVIRKPVNETEDWVRDNLIYNKDYQSSSSETGWRAQANSLLGWIRGANDTLSLKETEQRLKSAYTQSKFLELAKQEMKYVEDVVKGRITTDPITGLPLTRLNGKIRQYVGKLTGGNSEVFEQFNRALDAARNLGDVETKKMGYFFQTPSELHHFYQSNFKRPPSLEETSAYFAFTRAYEYDLALRNIRSVANKSRLGAEQWSYYSAKSGSRVASPTIDAIQHKTLPTTKDTLLYHTSNGSERLLDASQMSTGIKTQLKEGIESGKLKVIEIYDPEARALGHTDKEGNPARIRYVVSDALESKPLSYDQIGKRGGGHFEYDYDHYIKQAKVRTEQVGSTKRTWYEGDQTLMPIDNRIKGADVAAKFDKVRELLKAGKRDEAKAFANANLDTKWKDLESWFRPSKNPETGQMEPSRFNLDHPFEVVPKNHYINEKSDALAKRVEAGGSEFVDGTRHGSLARNFQVKYTGQRDAYDLFTYNNVGSRYNPVYKYQPAKLTDPIPTLTRALDAITNSLYMEDYKIFAAEHWLQENHSLLKASQDDIRSAPFYHFNNINSSSFRQAAEGEQVDNARINWMKIKQLTGTPDVFQTNMHRVKQFLHDTAYDKYGPRGDSLVPDWLLDRITSPIDFARSMAFHDKLGLFNPGQLLTQSATYVNLLALAPKSVGQGSMGALMHQWSRINKDPAILKGLGEYAEKFGWKPGHWEQALQTLDRTGFANVGGEFSLDHAMKHYYIRNGARQFLDAGQMFFRGAERNFRYGAWYTAFHEFKELNPLVKIGDKEVGQILRRADDLTGNMSRASNSILNKGILSVPAQFLTYQIRLAELFWSKRIGETLAERTQKRALLFGVYAAAFGVPGALGLSGLPLGDYWRKAAIENGYNVGESAAQSTMYEGLPSLIGALITGKGDFQSGNWYNWNDKLGANGFSPFREALRSNTSWWKLLGGAAGSVLGNTLSSMDGFTKAMYSMLSGQGEAFPMKNDDWLNMGNEVTSFSNARRMIYAVNYGKWLSKNEAYIKDVSKTNAVFMALTGLSPQELDDQYTKSWTKETEKETQKNDLESFISQFRKGAEAYANKDAEQGNDYYRRAFSYLTRSGYPRENWHQAIALAAKGYETTIDRSDYTYYMKDVPESRKPVAIKAYETRSQINSKARQ